MGYAERYDAWKTDPDFDVEPVRDEDKDGYDPDEYVAVWEPVSEEER